MLIDFTVENYRSIKTPVTLSAVASKRSRTETASPRRSVVPDDQIAKPYVVPNRKLELLPVLGLFGANASGKSNVLRALQSLISFIVVGEASRNQRNSLSWRTPFRLSPASLGEPTRFVLRTAHNGTIFSYTLVLNEERILSERMYYVPEKSLRLNFRLVYERHWNSDKKKYDWQNGREVEHILQPLQQKLSKSSTFANLLVNNLIVPVTSEWCEWMEDSFPNFMIGEEVMHHFEHEFVASILRGTQEGEEQLDSGIKEIVGLLKDLDTGLSDIEVDTVHNDSEEVRLWAIHKDNTGSRVRWAWDEESLGTQRLFATAFFVLMKLSIGGLVIADEFGANVHPKVTRKIISMFQNRKVNTAGAQLLFTSHDNTLQRGNLLRRDQIWLTQKREDGSTDLYSVADFKVRNDLALDKAYLDGRFGAVPRISDDFSLDFNEEPTTETPEVAGV